MSKKLVAIGSGNIHHKNHHGDPTLIYLSSYRRPCSCAGENELSSASGFGAMCTVAKWNDVHDKSFSLDIHLQGFLGK